MTDTVRTEDIEKLAEWLSVYVRPFRVSVFAVLPGEDGQAMAGPTALDVYLPPPVDNAAMLDWGTFNPRYGERYLSLPYDGGHLVITEPEFEYAVLLDERLGWIIAYLVGGIGLTFQQERPRG
jgi:hypothetical protein